MTTLSSGSAAASAGARIGGELDDDGTVAAPLQALPDSVFRAEASLVNRPAEPVASAAAARPAAAPARAPGAPPKRLQPPLESCTAIARSTIMGMFDRLKVEARRHDNMLTIDDLDELRGEFVERTRLLESELSQSVARKVRERLREHRSEARQFPFDRIIVHQFAHLFVRRNRGDLAHGALSRRVLPGFFVALEKMLGEAALEAYQDRARRIVVRYEEQLEVDGDWTPVYRDPHTHSLVLEALITIAGHFREFDKRRAWLLSLINGHLAPGDAMIGEGAEAASWELTEAACLDLLAELFRRLAEALTDAPRRRALSERFGQPMLREAIGLCRMIAAARQARNAADQRA